MKMTHKAIFLTIFFLLNCLITSELLAQKKIILTIKGSITDAETGKVLAGSTIAIDYKKTNFISDSLGNYALFLPRGEYVLKVSHIGYEPTRNYLTLLSDTTLNIALNDITKLLDEVIVSSSLMKQNALSPSLGVSMLSIKGIKKIPAMMGEIDILRSIQTLPGVSSVGEGANGVNIRGGAVDQNIIFIDDTPIFNPTHLFGLFSVFASDAIQNVELYKGGIPARYGGRTASILDIKMLNPSAESFRLQGGIGPISNKIMAEVPIVKNKLSVLTAARFSYNDFLFKAFAPTNMKNTRANFYDIATKMFYRPNEKNVFSLSTYLNEDFYRIDSLFSLENVVAKQTDFHYGHTNLSARWNHYYNEKTNFEVVSVYSNYKTRTQSLDSVNAIDLQNSIRYLNLKASLDFSPFQNHKANVGLSFLRYDIMPGTLNKGVISKIASVELPNEQAMELAIYADDEYKVNKNFTIQYGLRAVNYANLGPIDVRKYQANQPLSEYYLISTEKVNGIAKTYLSIEPRLTMLYILAADKTLKFGYNRTEQFLQLISNNTTPLPTARWHLADENIKPQMSDFLSLGFFKTWEGGLWEASAETYYRSTQNVLDYSTGANLQLSTAIETQVKTGIGKAYGIEFMLAKKKGNTTGWISYTFARSFQRTDGLFQEQKINNGEWYPTNYDKPHTLNLTLSTQSNKYNNFSFVFVVNSGRPFTSPSGTYTLNGQEIPLYVDRNNDRIPTYHRLDLSWTITNASTHEHRWVGSWIFTVYNIYGRKNPYSIFFTKNNDSVNAYSLSIFASPLVSLAYNFKFK